MDVCTASLSCGGYGDDEKRPKSRAFGQGVVLFEFLFRLSAIFAITIEPDYRIKDVSQAPLDLLGTMKQFKICTYLNYF